MAENRQLAIVTGAASGIVTGPPFLATHWDNFLPPPEAAEKCGAPSDDTDRARMNEKGN